MEAKNQPIKKFRAGALVATVWENAAERDGKEVTFNSVSFERRYKDKNDTWQSSHSLRVNDLPRAALVLQKAYEYLALGEEGAA